MDIKNRAKKTYYIKAPTGRRKSFAIMVREGIPPKTKTLKDSRVEAINNNLELGILSTEEARKQINQVKESLYQGENKLRGKLPISEINYQAFEKYISRYQSKESHMDVKAAINETRRALEALEEISIFSAPQAQIQSKINKLDTNKQKRVAKRLSSILKSIGRTDISLAYTSGVRKRVSHILLDDLVSILKHIADNDIRGGCQSSKDYSSLISFLFCSGCRIGEALVISKSDLSRDNQILKIREQLTQSGQIKATKTKRERSALIISHHLNLHFVGLKKSNINRFQAAKTLSGITKAMFPDEPIKHISLHGLRHSYAICLLNNGVSLKTVAKCIGDSISTTESYYIDYIEDDESLILAMNKLKKD